MYSKYPGKRPSLITEPEFNPGVPCPFEITIHLGYFSNFDNAVNARKEAEEKYFGEFSYEKSQTINI